MHILSIHTYTHISAASAHIWWNEIITILFIIYSRVSEWREREKERRIILARAIMIIIEIRLFAHFQSYICSCMYAFAFVFGYWDSWERERMGLFIHIAPPPSSPPPHHNLVVFFFPEKFTILSSFFNEIGEPILIINLSLNRF